MNLFEGYQAGVNLGGWISQFYEINKKHFDTFITEADIKQIASWGMDHVRLPIDYSVIEDDSNPFHYKEEGFSYIDHCIEWCKDNKLNIILDLHRAAGYAFHSLQENKLFERELLQKRFISLWQEFAKRYQGQGRNVTFELLNEIVEPNSNRWNALSKRAVEGIREIDKERVVIIGSNYYNSVNSLREMDYIADNRLAYTFHFYEPHIFTHQRAGWEPLIKNLNFEVPYPSNTDSYQKYLTQSEECRRMYYYNENMDKEFLRKLLQPALEFIKERKVELYCGEYGVIDHAPMDSNLRWHKDLCELLNEYKIGKAVWNYKLMSFPMVDRDSKVRNESLIQIVSKK